MRFSYLDIYVEHMAKDAEIRSIDDYTYVQDVTEEEWIKAEDGLMFFFNEFEDPDLRSGYIKIPEAHPLFNWSVLNDDECDCLFYTNAYKPFHNYGVEQIRQAGIPIDFEGARKYNNPQRIGLDEGDDY